MRVLIHGDQRLRPVIEALSLEQGCELVIFGNSLTDELRSRSIQYTELEDCVDNTIKQRVAETMPLYLELIMSHWCKLAGHPQAICEQKHILPAIEAELEQTVRMSLIEELLFIDAFDQCHRRLGIDAVCLLDDFPRPFLTITRAAQRHGIPVLHVAHGVYFYDEGRRLAADTMAVAGWYNAANLPAFGFDPGRIVVTGNPAWDSYSKLPSLLPPRNQIKRQLGVNPEIPLVAYFSTWSENKAWLRKRQEGFAALLVALRAAGLGGSHIVVKSHPFGDSDDSTYQRLASMTGHASISFCSHHKEILLWAADTVVLETASSLMIEGLLLERPVIVLRNEGEKGYLLPGIGWPHDSLLTCEPEPAGLAPVLLEVLPRGELSGRLRDLLPASIRKYNLSNDGRAAERVCRLLTSLPGSLAASAAG